MQMQRHIYFWLTLISILMTYSGISQKVAVSEDVNIRGDYAYEILPPIEDNILLYRDKGIQKTITAYDSSLKYKWEKKLTFDKKRVKVIGLVAKEDVFNIYYIFKGKDKEVIKVAKYDSGADIIDSVRIAEGEKSFVSKSFRMAFSNDRSKTVLYSIESSMNTNIYVIDNDSLWLDWHKNITIKDINLNQDLKEVVVSNNGEVFFGLVKNNTKFKKENHAIAALNLRDGPDSIKQITIALPDMYSQGVVFDYDNLHQTLGIVGLYGKKKQDSAEGYFYVRDDFRGRQDSLDIEMRRFSDEFIVKVYSKDSKKKLGLEHYKASNVIFRQDGGAILVTEMQRQYSRRVPYNGATSGFQSPRGWSDYFNEDILLISIHPDGKEHWKEMLYKKQFSQDDNNIYSSYFAFKTPSRLKFIFNDQIRTNNTVSEYNINGIGDSKRESLFSTEHQNIKLRIRDAIQISNRELIIPSERSSTLNIVKITYP